MAVRMAVRNDPQKIFHVIILIPGIFLGNIIFMYRFVSDHADLI